MPVSKRTCHFESESLISIAHFRKIMIAVCGSSKRTTSCGKPPQVFNTDQHYRPACAVFIWLRSRPRPLAVVEHSKTQRPQHSPPPALGPLPWCGLKKISARKGLVFPMERSLGGNKRAQSCRWAVSSKTAQLNVDVRCSEIPRFRLHRFSTAQEWITQHRGSRDAQTGIWAAVCTCVSWI